jgi:hypothetical protein
MYDLKVNKRTVDIDLFSTPELGAYPDIYFPILTRIFEAGDDKIKNKISNLYLYVAPLFEEYGFTTASKIAWMLLEI